jgi:uncharacterized protein (DUF1499 family)
MWRIRGDEHLVPRKRFTIASGVREGMLRIIRRTSFVILAVIGVLFAAALISSREEYVLAHVYEMVFGSPDLGPVDFETFRRSSRPNTALACPPGFCRNATADFDPGVFPFGEDELRKRITEAALREPRTAPVYRHASPGLPTQDRYIQRSETMSFPDTIDVRFIPLSESTSTLAIYSRSQLGYRDFGVNLARIRRWTEAARTNR